MSDKKDYEREYSHIRKEKHGQKRPITLDDIEPVRYDMAPEESIIADTVLDYLSSVPKKAAKRMMECAVKDKKSVGEDGEVVHLYTIDGEQLVGLINVCVGDYVDRLDEDLLLMDDEDAEDENEAMILINYRDGLDEIDAAETVRNMTVEFMQFLEDCLQAVR